MLAPVPHLASIELHLDSVRAIRPRENYVANDASFWHQVDCEFLLQST